MKILICGDRYWDDKVTILTKMESLAKDTLVIHGGARGADTLADECAHELGLPVTPFPADWQRFGKKAGPLRNRQMLDQKPDLVIAFHKNLQSSKGTKDCVNEARKRSIPVKIIGCDHEGISTNIGFICHKCGIEI